MDSIRVSKKHGVNPSITQCFLCGKDKDILLMGHISGGKASEMKQAGVDIKPEHDAEAPMKMGVVDMEPCQKCLDWMSQGIILISVADGEDEKADNKNPYRTGGWCVLKEAAVKKMLNDSETLQEIIKKRVAFVPDKVWDLLGLPRENINTD